MFCLNKQYGCVTVDQRRKWTIQTFINRIAKIQKKEYIYWRYVISIESSADVASRGCFGDKFSSTLFTGPLWLTKKNFGQKT